MNLNNLANEVAKREAGLEEVNIAQIKEIIRVMFGILDEDYTDAEIIEAIRRK